MKRKRCRRGSRGLVPSRVASSGRRRPACSTYLGLFPRAHLQRREALEVTSRYFCSRGTCPCRAVARIGGERSADADVWLTLRSEALIGCLVITFVTMLTCRPIACTLRSMGCSLALFVTRSRGPKTTTSRRPSVSCLQGDRTIRAVILVHASLRTASRRSVGQSRQRVLRCSGTWLATRRGDICAEKESECEALRN